MLLKILTMGAFQVNNYVLIDESSCDAVLIDAGGDFEVTKRTLEENHANLKYILHTHGHLDHIAGDEALQTKYGVDIYLHKADEIHLKAFDNQEEFYGMSGFKKPEKVKFINGNEEFDLAGKKIKTIYTPGHSKGGVSYLLDNMLFSGDTLFQESIGRTDFIGGNFDELANSIRKNLYVLPDETIVYPGHGPSTTIGHEKKYNCYAVG